MTMHDLKVSLTCEGDKAKVTLEVAFENAVEAIAYNERLAALNRMSAEPAQQRGNPLSLMARGLRTLPPQVDDDHARPANGRAC